MFVAKFRVFVFFFFLMQLDLLHLMTSWKAHLLIPSLAHSVLHCPLTVILLPVWIRATREVICQQSEKSF